MSEVRASQGFPLSVAVHTDVGRVRNNNEDSAGQAWLEDGSLWVMVADGMGGHEAGEVASNLAVQVVEEVVSRDASGDPRQRLYEALLESNEAILDEGRRSGKHGMGTTAIAAVVRGREAYVALIGDSRCYHVRGGHVIWRTHDHTRVQMLLDQGEISEEQAKVHPEAGMLTRALGHGRMADGRPLVPDVIAEPIFLEPDDALVLSSDGLHDLLDDHEIAREVAGRPPQEIAHILVQMACDRGGHDNITVAVVTAGDRAGPYDESKAPDTANVEPLDLDDPTATDGGLPPIAYASTGVMKAPVLAAGRPPPVAAAPPVAVAEEAESEGGSGLIIAGVIGVVILGLLVAGLLVAAIVGYLALS